MQQHVVVQPKVETCLKVVVNTLSWLYTLTSSYNYKEVTFYSVIISAMLIVRMALIRRSLCYKY